MNSLCAFDLKIISKFCFVLKYQMTTLINRIENNSWIKSMISLIARDKSILKLSLVEDLFIYS